MTTNIYSVLLTAEKIAENNKEGITPDFLKTDEEGLRLLKTLFNVIKNELTESVVDINNDNNLPYPLKRNITILYSYFSFNFDDDKEMEQKILSEINKLKKLRFHDGFKTITIEELMEDLKFLRLNRIKLWEEILSDFKTHKDIYIKKLMKMRAEHLKSLGFNK